MGDKLAAINEELGVRNEEWWCGAQIIGRRILI
jgi:hypothetical protein